MDYGTLQVTTPDGQVREYPIDVTSAFIGRADSNRVVIDHVSVSRRHARLLIEGDRVMVEDLSSATGTFVGGQRLAPETPRAIAPGELLRFGDASARFLAAQAPEAAQPITPVATSTGPGTPATAAQPPAQQQRATTDQAIVISLVSPSAPLTAGATTAVTCVVANHGAAADTLTIAVQGLPEGWARVTRPSLQLVPGAREEVTIVLQPPKTAEARAGSYNFAAAATSRLRGIEVRALGKMTLLAFGGQSLELKPVRSKGGFTVVVANTGNAAASMTLSGGERENALGFAFTPETLELEPGESRPVRLQAKTLKRRFFGAERIFPFEVSATGGVAPVSAAGEFRSRPPWLWIRWVVLSAVLGVVAVAGFLGYRQFSGDDNGSTPAGTATTGGAGTGTAVPTGATATTPRPTTANATTGVPTTVAPTTAAPLILKKGGNAVVINSPSTPVRNCLQVRASPAKSSPASFDICDGEKVKLLDGTGQPGSDGITWWNVQTAAGKSGWSAEGDPTSGEKWLQAAP